MSNKEMFFLGILALISISCKRLEEKKKSDTDLIFKNNITSIYIRKDSMSFGKISDKIEVNYHSKKTFFAVDKIQDIKFADSINGNISLRILTKKHNTKSHSETFLILNLKENKYCSLSTYNEYHPVGFRDTISATLSINRGDFHILLNYSKHTKKYRFKLDNNLKLEIDALNKNVLRDYSVNSFFYYKDGLIFDKQNDLKEIVVGNDRW